MAQRAQPALEALGWPWAPTASLNTELLKLVNVEYREQYCYFCGW